MSTTVDWSAIYQRQVARSFLVSDWLEALRLVPGDRVLDVGAGTGYVTLMLAERVGVQGHVYAFDRAEGALAYLAELQTARGLKNITSIVADAANVDTYRVQGQAVLLTLVLHAVNDPQAVITSVSRCIVPGGRLVVAEFSPDGPCETGAPRERRISPATLQQWCRQAGLAVVETRRQAPEYYMLVAESQP